MRVLLDECLPRRLINSLTGHSVETVPHAGWAGLTNGVLLARIAGKYDVFITVDKNLPVQQRTATLPFGVILLRAASNNLAALQPLASEILKALASIQAGEVIEIGAGDA